MPDIPHDGPAGNNLLQRLYQFVQDHVYLLLGRPSELQRQRKRRHGPEDALLDGKIPIDKKSLRELYKTFQRLTARQASDDEKSIFDESRGIYPLEVCGQIRGVRLGKSITPAESGSVCLQAMVHTNEPAGLAGLQEAIELWNGDGKHAGHPLYKHRNDMSGDIYLLFAGEIQQARQFFARVLDPNITEISIKELTRFRTTEGMTNRNRLSLDQPPAAAAPSQRELWNDYQALKGGVYKTCQTKVENLEKGENPGFIIGLHTFSQPADTTTLLYFFPFPPAATEQGNTVLGKVEDYVQQLCGMMGTHAVIIEDHHKESGEYYLEGVSGLDLSDRENPVIAGSPIRGTYECGQHLDPVAVGVAKNAVLNLLEYKFGPDLVRGAERPREHSLTFYGNTEVWFAPGSPRAGENPHDTLQHFQWLVPPKDENETFGNVHLITGHELSLDERNAWIQKRQKPERLVKFPEDVWRAIVAAKPGQLANEKELRQGQYIAWVDIIRADGTSRQVALRAPHAGTVFMAPMNPEIPAQQLEYVLHISRHKRQATIVLENDLDQARVPRGGQRPIEDFETRNTHQGRMGQKLQLPEFITKRLPANRGRQKL